jgi:hypothetical protein
MRRIPKLVSTIGCLVGLGLVVPASAHAEVVTQRYEEVSYDINTCTGDTVRLTGTYLLVVRTFGDDGFDIRYTYTLKGTGESGLVYTVSTQSAFTVSDDDTNFESTFRSRMISRGPAPDQWVVAHTSYGPDADPDDNFFTTYCRP